MSEFDEFKDDSSYEVRLEAHQRLLADFAQLRQEFGGEPTTYIEDAAEQLTTYYFRVLYRDVKPYMSKLTRVNRYKIASIVELCIVDLQLVLERDPGKRRRVNAQLAFYAGVGAIASFKKKDFPDIKPTAHLDKVMATMKKQHEEWLYCKKREDFPIFCNGAFLTLLHVLFNHSFPSKN